MTTVQLHKPRHGHATSADVGLTREALTHAVDHAAHYLPVQGPIGVFIHHNTLHAFQHLPFEEAVAKASEVFGTEPYMTIDAYERDFRRGRILEEDITAMLATEENALVITGGADRRTLRKAMLVPGLRKVKGQRAEWALKEGGWLKSFRTDLPPEARTALAQDTPQALWEACISRTPKVSHTVHGTSAFTPKKYLRPHAALFAIKHVDLDAIVHPPLINLVSNFVDQGVAHWQLPLRSEGLLRAFRALHGSSLVDPAGLGGLKKRLKGQVALDAEAIVLEALRELGVEADAAEHFIAAELLALPGWAGMVRKLENEPVLAEHQRVPCTLMDYLAVRLTLLVIALRNAEGDTTGWRTMASAVAHAPLRNELLLFDAAQLIGLSSKALNALDPDTFERLVTEITAFNELERRRIWHLAYERRHERLNLLPLAKHHTLPPVAPVRDRYRADVFFCIDER